MKTAHDDSLIGKVLGGRYEVLRPLASGGMGALYVVRHVELSREFALKMLGRGFDTSLDALARFRREAEVVASLRHRNVVEVIDWGRLDDGSPWMVLELLLGEDLATRIERVGQLPWPMLGRIADDVLSALSAAHRAGIVHRDLKPANIFLARDDSGEEETKLLDFGVSKILHGQIALTHDLEYLGTPAYMSPEQADARAHEAAPSSDVFAMGAILYEMATGQIAFDGNTVSMVIYRICTGQPDPLQRYRPDAPPRFVALLDRALAKDPAKRFADATALRAALRDAMAEIGAAVPAAPARASRELTVPATIVRATASTHRGYARRILLVSAPLLLLAGATLGYVLTRGRGPVTIARPAAPAPSIPTPQSNAALPASPIPTTATISTIHVTRTPPTARIQLDGADIDGDTIHFPSDGRTRSLRVAAPGYVDQVSNVDSHTPATLAIHLHQVQHRNAKPVVPASESDFKQLKPAYDRVSSPPH